MRALELGGRRGPRGAAAAAAPRCIVQKPKMNGNADGGGACMRRPLIPKMIVVCERKGG